MTAVTSIAGSSPHPEISSIQVKANRPTAAGQRLWHSPRIDTRHTHGTGCTLASACAVGLAQQMSLEAAAARAWDYVHRAMLQALASMSPMMSAAADVALEEEAERQAIPERTQEIIEQVRLDLHCTPAEARLARVLERALVEAADAVPDEEPLRRRA